jgi:hypothetical protein
MFSDANHQETILNSDKVFYITCQRIIEVLYKYFQKILRLTKKKIIYLSNHVVSYVGYVIQKSKSTYGYWVYIDHFLFDLSAFNYTPSVPILLSTLLWARKIRKNGSGVFLVNIIIEKVVVGYFK